MTSNLEPDGAVPGDARQTGLATRFIHAGMWLTAVRILNRLFFFVRLVVLTRLLTPADFGLFGLCMVAVQAMKVLTKSGFWAALLQKQGDVRPYLDTSFAVSVSRGVVLTVLLFAGAGMTSMLMGQPEAAPLLKVVCLGFLAEGLTSPAIVHYWRDLRLAKECVYQTVGTVSDLVVAIAAAIVLRNAWALVLGLLARDIAQAAVSYILAPHRIGGWGSLSKARQLFTFGGWIFVTSIMMFLLDQGTMLFVGRVLGVSALGLYVVASQVGSKPAREFISVLANPAFVAFSTLQNDLPKLRQAYLKTLQLISIVAMPTAVAVAVLAKNIVGVFLGDQWADTVDVLMVLGLWSGLQSVNITAYALIKAAGRPGVETQVRLWQILLVAAAVWPLCRALGLLGIGVALLGSELLISPLLWQKLREVIDLSLWHQFRLIFFPAAASAGMAAIVSSAAIWLNDPASIMHLIALTAIGSLAYVACILAVEFLFSFGAVKLIRQCIAGALMRPTLNNG